MWAGLNLAWTKGTAALLGIWNDFGTSFISGAADAIFGAVKIAMNAWDGLRAAWAQTVGFLNSAWINFTSTMKSAHSEAVGFVERQLLKLQGVMDESFDVDAAIEIANKNRQADQENIADERNKALSENEQETRERLGEIGLENEQAIAAIEKQAAATKAALKASSQAAVDAAQDDLEAAQKEFRDAMKQAREGDKGAGESEDGNGVGALADQLRGALDGAGVQGSTSKGLFNAANTLALQGGRTQDKIAKSSEQTASNTKRIARNQKRMQPKFA